MHTIKKGNLAVAPSYIEVVGGRVHNLQNIDLRLPQGKLIVVTGPSGSGKSSLTIHLLYAESHRRYMSTLESSFVRYFINTLERPDVDQINGLPSVIGIQQEMSSIRSLRSTVGTLTDIYAFLRLLYARIADAYSYLSGNKMVQQSEKEIQKQLIAGYSNRKISFWAPIVKARKGHYQALFAKLYKQGFKKAIIDGKMHTIQPNMQLDRYRTHTIQLVLAEEVLIPRKATKELVSQIKQALDYGKGYFSIAQGEKTIAYFSRFLMDPSTGLSYSEPLPNTFSFNSLYGACRSCQGIGSVHQVNRTLLIPNPKLSIAQGGIPLLGRYRHNTLFRKIEEYLNHYGYDLVTPIRKIKKEVLESLLQEHSAEDKHRPSFKLARLLLKKVDPHSPDKDTAIELQPCPACQGTRLNKEALHFKIDQKNIAEISKMDLQELYEWLQSLPKKLSSRKQKIAASILDEIRKRVQLLLDIGLPYLSLARPLRSLSGGEIRRIRIATQIGTQDTHLVGVMYILDEPSIGLHPRDNQKLINALKALRDLGNTVIVIEHDEETMLQSDYLLEIGPGAGRHGGQVVAAGPLKHFLKQKSLTADFLTNAKSIAIPTHTRKGNKKKLVLKGCTGNTLKNISLKLPLGKFIAITGPSGSGKSTLKDTLLSVVKRHFGQFHSKIFPCKHAQGLQNIDKVIEINQKPIGRTSRSNVATYTKLFELIRSYFTILPQAQIRGYTAGRFSFNVKGGRCETCKGVGEKLIQMDFLPSVRIPCEVCKGRYYNRETLEVQYRGKSIADVLHMNVEQAIEFFQTHPKILEKLRALEAVGLGYIQLGQHATTLSGGESQRVKLATELTKKASGNTLYVLDEPTTGLHFQDIEHLLAVLHKLVAKGNTVVCVEHNLDLVKTADHVVDLGPGAGHAGGYLVAEGSPQELAEIPESPTGPFLKGMFAKVNASAP